MFQFPSFPFCDYFIHHRIYGSSPYGFPHSEIPGLALICSYPRLIAACHVLLRLLMPRHSPYALLRLNFSLLLRLVLFAYCMRFAILFSSWFFFLSFEKTLFTTLVLILYFTTLVWKDQFFFNCFSLFSYLFVSYSVFNDRFEALSDLWLAQVDSNHRPRAYQARALTN